MSRFVDTSVMVRYLTGVPAEGAEQAAGIIDQEEGLQVTDVALAETAFVLASVYHFPRDAIVDHLVSFVRKANISLFGLRKDVVIHALLMCRPSGRVSFGDALIWAAARSSGSGVIYSFDGRFPSESLTVLREKN